MPDPRGIYRKYDVRRVDGQDAEGCKHHGCRLFVLDLDHDPHAVLAIRAYAVACRKTQPQLADELTVIANAKIGGGRDSVPAKEHA
jgi:hypothetical protein